jgi:hypothetical protein
MQTIENRGQLKFLPKYILGSMLFGQNLKGVHHFEFYCIFITKFFKNLSEGCHMLSTLQHFRSPSRLLSRLHPRRLGRVVPVLAVLRQRRRARTDPASRQSGKEGRPGLRSQGRKEDLPFGRMSGHLKQLKAKIYIQIIFLHYLFQGFTSFYKNSCNNMLHSLS